MKYPTALALIKIGLALALTAATGLASAQTSFTSSYKGGTGTCGTTYSITGKEPSASGTYPLFVYIGGTGESYTSVWGGASLDAAVARGFVAASVEYDNASFGSCSTITSRAKCIFDSNNTASAVAKLCARPKVDCSKGVVTGGLSQGSVISVLAKNYDARVRASWGQGNGTTYTAAYNLASCMTNGKHTQSGDRLRVINGERDMFVGGTEATARSQAQIVTGLTCTGKQSCFRANGSGWYIVKDLEVLDLYADHCFMGYGGTAIAQCAGVAVNDANYVSGNNQWGVKASMDWLKTFVD